VLAADAGAGEEAGRVEVPSGPGKGRGDGSHDVQREGDEEELLTAEPVGQLAEEEGAQAGTPDIEGRGSTNLAGIERDSAARFGQAVADAADDRHLEAVEDPNRPQPDDD